MSTDVHQSVNSERTTTDVAGDTEGARAGGAAALKAVGGERDVLSQEMGASGAKAQLPLSLRAQMSEEQSSILLRIQRKEAGVGETDLGDL